METKEIGKRIKEVRKQNNLTQTQFGDQIGVKGNTITGYENGTRCPSDAVIKSICLVFGTERTWLCTGKGEMYTSMPDSTDSLQKLFSDFSCNNLEIRFLDAYFKLIPKERKAFCELLEKMFPEAISKIVGANPLASPFVKLEEAFSSEAKSPQEMTREEIHAELDRQLDAEKEAVEDALGYGYGSSGMATG